MSTSDQSPPLPPVEDAPSALPPVGDVVTQPNGPIAPTCPYHGGALVPAPRGFLFCRTCCACPACGGPPWEPATDGHGGVCEDPCHRDPDTDYDYAAELARYPHSEIIRLLNMAERLAANLEADDERWPNVDQNMQRLRDELTRRGWRRVYSVWELLDLGGPSQTSTGVDDPPDEKQSDDPAPTRAEKIAAAIGPDQLDQYLGAGECDLHDVCRDGKRQCPYHQALAAGPSSPTTFRPEGT